MKTDSLGQTLEESLNNPESWIRQAEQQFLVAESIAPGVRQPDPSEKNYLMAAGVLKTTVLLLALCAENSFKAVKAAREEFKVDERGLIRSTRGGGNTGHTLLALAEEIGFTLSFQETKLLERLTEIGIWAGKYHAPIHHKAFEAANAETPKSLTLPHDLNVIKNILGRAAQLAEVPTVITTQVGEHA